MDESDPAFDSKWGFNGLEFPAYETSESGLVSWLLGLSFGLASDAAAPEEFATNSVTSVHEATNYLGVWIWDKETHDKQTCRFWKRFEIPKGTRVIHAQLRLTADNAFTLFLDGRELGKGSDWRTRQRV